MIKTLVFLAPAVMMVLSHAVHTHNDEANQSNAAVAHLEGELGGHVVLGDLTFTLAEDKMLITGKITGMPPGHYGLNIHESGDISDGCSNVRGHLNPHGHDHGHPDDDHRHVGDLGNIYFNEQGVATVKIEDRLVKLWGIQGIVGRSVALASMKDDHGRGEHPSSKIDGHGGSLVACGVVGIK